MTFVGFCEVCVEVDPVWNRRRTGMFPDTGRMKNSNSYWPTARTLPFLSWCPFVRPLRTFTHLESFFDLNSHGQHLAQKLFKAASRCSTYRGNISSAFPDHQTMLYIWHPKITTFDAVPYRIEHDTQCEHVVELSAALKRIICQAGALSSLTASCRMPAWRTRESNGKRGQQKIFDSKKPSLEWHSTSSDGFQNDIDWSSLVKFKFCIHNHLMYPISKREHVSDLPTMCSHQFVWNLTNGHIHYFAREVRTWEVVPQISSSTTDQH